MLPRSESRQKIYEEAEQVAQKTYIIPVENKSEESPLMKSRLMAKDVEKSGH